MQIDLAMLWDQLNMKYPELESPIYGSYPVRGIKLLPASGVVDPEFLYLTDCEHGLLLSCGGLSSVLPTELSLDTLFNDLQDVFNDLRDWKMETHKVLIEGCIPQKLMNLSALIEGRVPQKLLDLSEKILQNPVTLMDPSYKLLACTSHLETDSPIFNQVRKTGYLPADTVEFYRLRGYMDDLAKVGNEIACLSEGTCVSVIYPLRVYGTTAGFLTMPCVNRAYSQGVAECFRYLAEGIVLCMEHQLHTSDIDRYMYEYLLIDILNEKLSGEAALEERLRYIDLPSRGEFVLLVVDGGQEYASVSNYLVRQISEYLPNDRVFFYQNQILVLLAEKRMEWALDTLLPVLKASRLSCGVSRSFGYLLELLPAYHQARAALRLGSRISALRTLEQLGVEGLTYEQHIYRYPRYAPYHIVESAAQAGILSPYIRKLIETDRRDNMDHLRVLHGFLACERRPTQTAAVLHMHRNNVIYRMDRMEQTLGISLEDTAIRRELECSLLVLELMSADDIKQNAQ